MRRSEPGWYAVSASSAERVVFDLETLPESGTLARLDDYVAVVDSLGWLPSRSTST